MFSPSRNQCTTPISANSDATVSNDHKVESSIEKPLPFHMSRKMLWPKNSNVRPVYSNFGVLVALVGFKRNG